MLSPSSMTTGVPNDESLSSSAWAKVDFPAPERPVSHTTNGREFIAGAEFIQSGRRPDVGAGVNLSRIPQNQRYISIIEKSINHKH